MRLSGALLLAAIAAGCATTSTEVAALPVLATVTNSTGKTIGVINYRSCDNRSGEWIPLELPALAPNTMNKFQLPAACVDLQALYSDGKVAGSQTGVRRDFPFKWVLS
jgi:hypothetical protein